MKEKELFEENKCNNFYISDSIDRARMVQQFRNGMERIRTEEYSRLRTSDYTISKDTVI